MSRRSEPARRVSSQALLPLGSAVTAGLRGGCALLLVALAARAATAQLTDLQPGRNFPTALLSFGAGRSENLDVGDVDEDGDYDVVVANGGDTAAQANRIFLNNGGLQGGVQGTFTDATAERFLGVTVDTSRDVELADIDGDTDLDVFICNRGTLSIGEVSRSYTNLGGLQHGTVGYFNETTDAFWGTLVSVPLSSEVGVQDGFGPFGDWSCDCDFGDLDADGDLDLFFSSYGPNINGTLDSRIFLNTGAGRFDELWPWANASADTKLHTFDVDLADLDDDFDLDIIASSRESQARIYRSNHSTPGWTGTLFTDITQGALIATGSALQGTSNYATEFSDIDGDGDFDLWMDNYSNFTEIILENQGHGAFTKTTWIKGDQVVDEQEVDFLDYDSDGDLDTLLPNFSGTNSIFQSGLADGVPEALGLMHRTNTTTGGSLAPWPETPTANNGGTTLDGHCADLDGDGDPDVLLSNDANQGNRYWQNVLGVPDTHAPTFHAVSVQGDKSDGSDTVILAAIRDNAPYYIMVFYDAWLLYTVDGGPPTCVRMSPMGGQQYRGLIPGGIDGTVAYHVEVTDDAGNLGVSATTSYVQSSSGSPLWQNLGCGTQGEKGVPYLQLSGSQLAGQPVALSLVDAASNALFLQWIALAPSPFPALGGTVYAFPYNAQVLAATDAGGMVFVSATWPAGLPSGTSATWQAVIADPTSLHGLVLSNAVRSIAP